MVGKEIHTTIVRSSTPRAVLATRALVMWGTSTLAMKTGWGQSGASQVLSDLRKWKIIMETRDSRRTSGSIVDTALEALLLSSLRSHAPRPAGGKLEQLLKFYETLWELMQTQASDQAEVPCSFFLVVNSTLIQVPCGKRGKNIKTAWKCRKH